MQLAEIFAMIKSLAAFVCRFFCCRTPECRPRDPPFDPSKPSPPISYPITTLGELESRSYFASFHCSFNRASVPLPRSAAVLPHRRRILVCHDMKGGYADDLRVQGGSNPDAYAIWHWHLMDVFVYFSHYLVTLPPPCWTNAAHTHGVKVLGTFLAEWDEGRAICDALLMTKESAHMYAERLTELATALGFDGWLVNMEVELKGNQIDNLKEFVHHLSNSMHALVPGSLVIWYDSVTIEGKLAWQDQLNDKNKPFFDLCDGIFVNYTWKEGYPEISATKAGERRYDVYMGIDVFGRNTFGGGQWNTNVALDVLKKYDVSAAIFAPGWVYETEQEPDFQTAQNRWWGLVEQSWGILQNYPKMLPFFSGFDQGRGYHFSIEGSEVSKNPWNNISSQGFQPLMDNCVDPASSSMKACIDFKDASYCGGGCISIEGSLKDNSLFSTRLFHGQLLLEDQPVYISYSAKLVKNSLIGLYLELLSDTKERTVVLLANDSKAFTNVGLECNSFIEAQTKGNVEDVSANSSWFIYEANLTMNGYMLVGIYAVCALDQNPGLIEILNDKSSNQASSLSDTSGSSHYYASLGHISIRLTEQGMVYPPADSWVTEGSDVVWISDSHGDKTLNLKITWKLKEGQSTSSFTKYIIYVESGTSPSYFGFARVEAFYVSDLYIPSGVTSVRFIIQVCGHDGTCQKLCESPALELAV